MNHHIQSSTVLERRKFLVAAGGILAGATCQNVPARIAGAISDPSAREPHHVIKRMWIDKGVTIEDATGTRGSFAGSSAQDIGTLRKHLPQIQELLVGRDPFDAKLDGELLWEAVYPGKARLYAEGRDPLTGTVVINKARTGRHTDTGCVFMAFSSVDIALWDLRGRLRAEPAYRVIGTADRQRVPVYWRPGEADKGLDDARRRTRDAYDRGYHYQKWYFRKSARTARQA